jgi:chromosome segregation ATPase
MSDRQLEWVQKERDDLRTDLATAGKRICELVGEVDTLRASLSAAERDRDRAVDLAKEYRDALDQILPERDAAERRVGGLKRVLRRLLGALDKCVTTVKCAEDDVAVTAAWGAARAALSAKEGTP